MTRGGQLKFSKGGRRRNPAWHHVAEICRRYVAGASQRAISDDYDCSPETIGSILDSMKIPRGFRTRKLLGSKHANATGEPRINVVRFPHTARDACNFCGVRPEVGCKHNRASISMGAF